MLKKTAITSKALCLLVLLITVYGNLLAQNRVTGRVINVADNQPVVGATVQVKGATDATQTGSDGSFALSVPSNATLVISVIGYTTQEVGVNGRSEVSISMVPAAGGLEEVVVVGYGTQRRTKVTGAISNVSGKTINELPVASVSQALQGRVAGVQVTNNGSPGTQPIVRFRKKAGSKR